MLVNFEIELFDCCKYLCVRNISYNYFVILEGLILFSTKGVLKDIYKIYPN